MQEFYPLMEMYLLICRNIFFLENTVAAISLCRKMDIDLSNGPQTILKFNQTRNKTEHSLLFLKATFLAHFEEIFDVFVPNSFTPNNGDYDNNVFQVSVFTENEYLFNIKILIDGDSLFTVIALNAWDGTNAKTGAQVPDGIYIRIECSYSKQ